MGFNLKSALGTAKEQIGQVGTDLNEALYPNPNSVSGDRLGAFGGQSTGLAKEVTTEVAKLFMRIKLNLMLLL